jgi:hypothetical protein
MSDEKNSNETAAQSQTWTYEPTAEDRKLDLIGAADTVLSAAKVLSDELEHLDLGDHSDSVTSYVGELEELAQQLQAAADEIVLPDEVA